MDVVGYRTHASGLLVPTEVSRLVTKHSKDDWRLLDRATKLVTNMGLQLFLKCAECSSPIERHRMPDGGIALRCEKHEHVFTEHL